MLLTSHLKSKKPHNSFEVYWNLMRIFLFERSYKYLPLIKILEKENIIEVIGTCLKIPKAHFGPYGPLGIKCLKVICIKNLILLDFAKMICKC